MAPLGDLRLVTDILALVSSSAPAGRITVQWAGAVGASQCLHTAINWAVSAIGLLHPTLSPLTAQDALSVQY